MGTQIKELHLNEVIKITDSKKQAVELPESTTLETITFKKENLKAFNWREPNSLIVEFILFLGSIILLLFIKGDFTNLTIDKITLLDIQALLFVFVSAVANKGVLRFELLRSLISYGISIGFYVLLNIKFT